MSIEIVSISEIKSNAKNYKDDQVNLGKVLCKKITKQTSKRQKLYLRDKEGSDIYFINNFGEKTKNKKLKKGYEYEIYWADVKIKNNRKPFLLSRSHTKIKEVS